MSANALERAVIEAARAFAARTADDALIIGLMDAVQALDAHLAAQPAGEIERGWHEVAEGDRLKSIKNGRFYPVIKALKVRKGYEITIRAGDKPVTITRPTEAEPTATVIRGVTGDAVDTITYIFSSGGL